MRYYLLALALVLCSCIDLSITIENESTGGNRLSDPQYHVHMGEASFVPGLGD